MRGQRRVADRRRGKPYGSNVWHGRAGARGRLQQVQRAQLCDGAAQRVACANKKSVILSYQTVLPFDQPNFGGNRRLPASYFVLWNHSFLWLRVKLRNKQGTISA